MQTITTKYLAPTNSRGPRIKVMSWQGSKVYNYDYEAAEPHKAAFDTWLKEKNSQMLKDHGVEDFFKLVGFGGMPDGAGFGFLIK